MTESDTTTTPTPAQSHAHARAAIAAVLAFQVIVIIFALMIGLASAFPSLMSPTADAALGRALRLSIYLTLPVGITGTVLGIVGIMHANRHRKFAKVGLLLCAIHTIICLIFVGR